MSLRARLLAASLVLVTAGLLVASAATYSALRSFLFDRVDQQLDAAQAGIERARGGSISVEQLGAVAPRVFLQRFGADGTAGPFISGRGQYEQVYMPDVPAGVVEQAAALHVAEPHGGPPGPGGPGGPGGGGDRAPARLVTVPSTQRGGPDFRVRLSPLSDDAVLAVALPLDDLGDTLHRLFLIELFVTIAVVAIAAGVGLWLVRLGLRPLADIEATAATISGGDLSNRVAREDDRTEVGRLGKALNVMLGRLDASFAEQKRFVADASHELRTPVAAVRAYAELYRMGADKHPEDLPRVMANIEAEAARMGVLVDDLLLLARLDEGRPLEHAAVDLGAVATDAVSAARAVDPERLLTLDVDGSVEVWGDRGRLRQVVDNLLANVRSHTPAGTRADVHVIAENGKAVVEVADHGPGLPGGDTEQLFERFYRVDPSRARDSGGSGLGLSIVAAIAGAHRGKATARARDGGGAVFRIELPVLDGDAPD
ncbi:MAG: two-component system, OmpR family, sensor kinase [Actinomycetota bacterium]|jgi:two-component system OmpR family sensor kinase